tara:strand:- start:1036 stop:1251 length:216 start_codon:yes stop_codon:yes gene_type:complete
VLSLFFAFNVNQFDHGSDFVLLFLYISSISSLVQFETTQQFVKEAKLTKGCGKANGSNRIQLILPSLNHLM